LGIGIEIGIGIGINLEMTENVNYQTGVGGNGSTNCIPAQLYFIPHLCLTFPLTVTPSEFLHGIPYGETSVGASGYQLK